jgi:membrane-associated phospholipid phosphatase
VQFLQTLDLAVFRFINGKLAHPALDQIMPVLSANVLFYPILFLMGIVLVCKGGRRGLVCVVMLLIILPLGDHWVCRVIKKAVQRPRPYIALAEVRKPGVIGHKSDHVLRVTPKTATGSMPSSHAANWFAAVMITFVYYRRVLWFLVPAAICVSFSRIYNGAHYPSDVLAGAILGAGYAAATLWSLELIWRWAGPKWFPLWWNKLPSIVSPQLKNQSETEAEDYLQPQTVGGPTSRDGFNVPHVDPDLHWLRLGYVVTAVLLISRLVYIAGDTIDLTGDEAYQWVWSKYLALSYYSKPPLIAYAQFLGTSLFGDTAFGVRFFSPISSALISLLILRFFAREVNARAGFFLLLITTATPLLAAGGVLMTVDVFSVLFWTAAMLAGWRAVQPDSTTRCWLWVGLWMGLGFLSKYTALFQWSCWALFFLLWPPARAQLRRAGPWLALLINFLCSLPVLIWNHQHDWITVTHVKDDARTGRPWSPAVHDFLASEFLLLNPVFFVAMVWAGVLFWRRNRYNPKLVYFFSMGAPVFLIYFFWSFHSRIQPNWIVPSVLPLFCMMVIYWDTRWRMGLRTVKLALVYGLGFGLALVIIGHDTELIGKLTGHYLPVHIDPLYRARGWREVAQTASEVRGKLLVEGKPVFIITSNYRLAGELSFYLPEAREHDGRLVYFRSTSGPVNQFYFLPGYTQRKDENAIYIVEVNRHLPKLKPPPPELCQQFESVEEIGVREVLHRDRVLWRLQFFACRGLR